VAILWLNAWSRLIAAGRDAARYTRWRPAAVVQFIALMAAKLARPAVRLPQLLRLEAE
jgi:hypothetical protein